MQGAVIKAILRRSSVRVRHVSPIGPDSATDAVAAVYQQVERDFGILAPPMVLHSPSPRILAAAWLMLREAMLVPGRLPRAEREAVATAVSATNECPYCVTVHDMAQNAIQPGREYPALTEWATNTGVSATAHTQELPRPASQAAELVAVVVTFQYLNRMVNVFLPDTPMPSGLPQAARRRALTMIGRVIRSAADRADDSRAPADLLPPAQVPDDLAWTRGNSRVAQAFAAAAAAISATDSVPDAVRTVVEQELACWDGTPRGLSQDWLEEALTPLATTDRPAARLALLTTFASYRVTDEVVSDFRGTGADDRALVELTAWASFTAARRVAQWIRID